MNDFNGYPGGQIIIRDIPVDVGTIPFEQCLRLFDTAGEPVAYFKLLVLIHTYDT